MGKKDKTSTAAAGASSNDEYFIKPSTATPALDTSEWPLLLKNYDSLVFIILFVLTFTCTFVHILSSLNPILLFFKNHPTKRLSKHQIIQFHSLTAAMYYITIHNLYFRM